MVDLGRRKEPEEEANYLSEPEDEVPARATVELNFGEITTSVSCRVLDEVPVLEGVQDRGRMLLLAQWVQEARWCTSPAAKRA